MNNLDDKESTLVEITRNEQKIREYDCSLFAATISFIGCFLVCSMIFFILLLTGIVTSPNGIFGIVAGFLVLLVCIPVIFYFMYNLFRLDKISSDK